MTGNIIGKVMVITGAVYCATKHAIRAVSQPDDADVNEILFRPTVQPV